MGNWCLLITCLTIFVNNCHWRNTRTITNFSYVVLMVMMQITKIHGFQLQSCTEANQITQWNIYRQCQSVPMNTSHKV